MDIKVIGQDEDETLIKIKKSDEILRFSTSGGYADINSEKVILVLDHVKIFLIYLTLEVLLL